MRKFCHVMPPCVFFQNCTSRACIGIFIFVYILLSAVVLTVLVEFANLMFLWPGIDPLSLQKWLQFWGLHKYWLNAIVSIRLKLKINYLPDTMYLILINAHRVCQQIYSSIYDKTVTQVFYIKFCNTQRPNLSLHVC